MKNTITIKMAGVASLILMFVSNSGHPVIKPGARVKNKTTASKNRKATLFSCDVTGPNSLYRLSIIARATFSPSSPISDSLASGLFGLN